MIHGAQKILLAPKPPLILIEMNDPEAIGGILLKAGYQGAYLYRRRWYPTQALEGIKSRNMLWFRPDSPQHRERLTLINFCA